MIAETIVRKSVPTDRTEHQEQAALMGWVKKNEHKWGGALRVLYAIPNQGARNPNGDGQRKRREGMRAGVPDVCLPVARKWFAFTRLIAGRILRAAGGICTIKAAR